ncbi:MAG: NAD(P)H-quinone oxidoreductase [Halieaceae bacterium]|jgi:putative PIG3 family NAD(P)H quinone oxidoreductase|nr:NAD(P)H-quinone oxidoreductase [Halieaceae bacterium]
MHHRHYIAIKDPETLQVEQDDIPGPAAGEVLIDVAYAGINRADVLQRLGLYPAPEDASPIMGLEVSGTVAAVGPDVTDWAPGDRVCALTHGGGYASCAIARADHCLAVPDGYDLAAAAALPEALLTSWHNIFERGGLRAGETLLVQGGASGIGTIAVQMAAARDAHVIATAGTEEKCELVRSLGAAFVANYRDGDFVAQLTEAGYAGRIDVILDMAGGDFEQHHINLAAIDGRIVCIGVMRGMESTINLAALFMKRLVLTGSTLRAMPHGEKAASFSAIREEVMPLVNGGQIRPQVHAVVPLARALEGHQLMLSGQHSGKIVLQCSGTQT